MNISLLKDLDCPSTVTGQRCQGQLRLAHTPESRLDQQDSDELVEGLLECSQCGVAYPVLCGVAILVPEPAIYLQSHYKTIFSLALEQRLDIGAGMRAYLHEIGAHLGSGAQKTSEDGPRALANYLHAHYDQAANLFESLPPEHPLAGFGTYYRENDIYAILLTMLRPHLSPQSKILDLGCHVGRLARDLAAQGHHALGIDISFTAIFFARRAIRAWPLPLDEYEIMRDGLKREKRPLNLPALKTGEALVASATHLPLKPGAYQAVVSANLIDVLPDPLALLRQMHFVLAEEGLVALSTPYHSGASQAALRWLGANSQMEVSQALRWRISHHFEIIEEHQKVPWVLGEHERRFQIYLNDCLLGRKTTKQ